MKHVEDEEILNLLSNEDIKLYGDAIEYNMDFLDRYLEDDIREQTKGAKEK